MLGGRGGRRLAMTGGAAVFARQSDADQPLDVAQKAHLLGARDQRDRGAFSAGARGAADAMDIGLGHVGQIEVHHMADAVDVDAARGDIGGDQRADLAGAERRQHPLAVVLRLVAMNGVGADAGPFQALHHLVGAVLGAGKHQRAVDRFLLEELRQDRGLGRMIDLDDALDDALHRRGHRRHRHAGGIALADVVDEAHVEHAVGLVEHEEFDLVELEAVALHEVEQAAGGRDHDFDALHDRADLAAHRHAADRQRRGQPHVAAIGIEAVEDLSGQFAGRAQHQDAAGLRLRSNAVFQNAMQDGKREGCGLAGAGLRDADDVTAGQRGWNGLRLDRRRGEVIFFLERTGDGIGKAEILKGGQKVGLSM